MILELENLLNSIKKKIPYFWDTLDVWREYIIMKHQKLDVWTLGITGSFRMNLLKEMSSIIL